MKRVEFCIEEMNATGGREPALTEYMREQARKITQCLSELGVTNIEVTYHQEGGLGVMEIKKS